MGGIGVKSLFTENIFAAHTRHAGLTWDFELKSKFIVAPGKVASDHLFVSEIIQSYMYNLYLKREIFVCLKT